MAEVWGLRSGANIHDARCRGQLADFYVEACDAKSRIALPADLADGSAAAEDAAAPGTDRDHGLAAGSSVGLVHLARRPAPCATRRRAGTGLRRMVDG